MITRFERFSSSIFTIFRYIQHLEMEEMEKYGLKGCFAQYLLVMDRHEEGITATQLGKLCDKDKAAVSRALNEMMEKGLVCRKKGQNQTYRAPLCLTRQGKQAAAFVAERTSIAVEAAGEGLGDEHRKIFYDTLDLIADNLKKICDQGIPEKE